MKRFGFLLVVVVLSLSSHAAAAPPTGVEESLAKYIALGTEGCVYGGVTFANFGYAAKANGGAQPVTPDQINIRILLLPGSPQLVFSSNWKAAAGETQDSYIKYTVQPHATNLEAEGLLLLQMGTFQLGLIGSVTVDETTDLGDLQVTAQCADACTAPKSDSLEYWPLGQLQVLDHVNLAPKNGEASLSSFTATFNFCPPCA
jgi:hypothetical protein